MNSLSRRVSLALPFAIGTFLVAIIIIYGFVTVYYRATVKIQPDNTTGLEEDIITSIDNILLLMLDTVFTMIGFGLLLSSYRHQKWTGMSIALFVVSFNIILGLLFQDMWFEILFGFRKDITSGDNGSIVAPGAHSFWNRHKTIGESTASYLSFRLSNLCSTSFLVGMTAWNGRVTFTNIVMSLPVFCFLYYFNLYLNMLFCYSTGNKNNSFTYFDAYGTIVVYLFGSLYGLIAGLFTKTPVQTNQQIQRTSKSKVSLQFSLLGSLFLVATFCQSYTGTLTNLSSSTSPGQSFRFNSQALLVMFGIASGIIGNYTSQLLINKGKANIQGIIIGTITGGIMVGGLADMIDNIGAVLFIAFIAGAISGAFSQIINNKINHNSIIDSHGLLGPILVVSLIASFIIYPSILSQFFIRKQTLTIRGTGLAETDYRLARYHLVYFVITICSAIFTGILVGSIFTFKRNPNKDYEDTKFFIDDYGLYNYQSPVDSYNPASQIQSAANLNPESQVKLATM